MTTSSTIMSTGRGPTTTKFLLRLALLASLVVFGNFYAKPASASGAMIAASAEANNGLSACNSQRGKALYNCVADVLDRLNSDISSIRVPETQSALRTAAAGLRAANTKTEALSAITQCRAVVMGALKSARAAGFGDGLQAVANVLARAVRLIQTKG